jgi:ribA/ribD-fused uncharacterized protein
MTRTAAGSKSQPDSAESTKAPEAIIRFYRANEKPYGAFSNLFRRPMVFEDCVYPSAEHAYQAGKARKEEVRRWLLSAPSPALVAMAAHGLYTWDIVSEWSKIKFVRMKGVLLAKYAQHEDLRKLLLSTGNSRLVEAGTVDNLVNRTWGEVNSKGRNMLGVLLMEVREELRAAEPKRARASSSLKPRQTSGGSARARRAAR